MGVKEANDISSYNNIQLRNKINRMLQKIDKLTEEEKVFLEQLKKEAWRRGMDDII